MELKRTQMISSLGDSIEPRLHYAAGCTAGGIVETIVVQFEEINLKFKKVRDPHSITNVTGRHSVLSIL